jgi:Methyltransferase domain
VTTNLDQASRSWWTTVLRHPRLVHRLLSRLPFTLGGLAYGHRWEVSNDIETLVSSEEDTWSDSANPLKSYFDAHKEGRGIWKWIHYFDIYHRHFSRFIGRDVHVVEVGIYSGGSLAMWRHYFGAKCHVYGIDITDACKSYEDGSTRVFIGDQADRAFWRRFKDSVPHVDILIDDGGHRPEQRIVTLEEMLPHLRPGGVYLCEDIRGDLNRYTTYVHGLATQLNSWVRKSTEKGVIACTPFQSAIQSIHLYPFVSVIERNHRPIAKFISEKHGTEWQPFLPGK